MTEMFSSPPPEIWIRIRRFISVTAFVFCCISPVLNAQIFTDDGTPISPETPQLREKLRYQDNENANDLHWSHEFSYALNPANELRLDVPVRHRNIQFTDDSGTGHSETLTGLGDVSLQWQHSLDQTDWVMGSNRLALNLKLEAPTGNDDELVGGVEIPRRLQLGSGDWSTSLGGVYTRVEDRQRFSIQGVITHNTRHDGMRMGEELDLNIAYWYRLHPVKHDPEKDQTEIRGVFELLSNYRFPSERGGTNLEDDGLNLWASPGVQIYVSPKIQLETAVQVPISQKIDDDLGDRYYGVQFNLKILF